MSEVQIKVTDRKGRERQLSAAVGSTLMEAMKADGLPIAATCGGAKSCATCHVYINEGHPSFGLPDEDEIDLLSESNHYRDGVSRLSCQIEMTSALIGLQVELAPQG